MADKPLIIQSDRSMLLDVHHPLFAECRNAISPFSELIKSPEHVHTYAVTSLSLWNSLCSGSTQASILDTLAKYSAYGLPDSLSSFITDVCSRFGVIKLTEEDGRQVLRIHDNRVAFMILGKKAVTDLLGERIGTDYAYEINPLDRGSLKVLLIKLGFPVEDLIPLNRSEDISIAFKPGFSLRPYQKNASDSLLGDGRPGLGYGVIVAPCGSGKTIIGLDIIIRLHTPTIILCPSIVSAHQWRNELLDKTDIKEEDIGEFSGESKNPRSITLCTYQALTYRPDKDVSYFPNMDLVKSRPWGLVIYDEVHMLPAPVFKFTASLQNLYRVGLTATLIREDGLEADVFSLVGPKRFDEPWVELQNQGFIASATCTEIRIPLSSSQLASYYSSGSRAKFTIASCNVDKTAVVKELLERHKGQQILIIGQFLDQLKELSETLGYSLLTGSTSNKERERLYSAFRNGEEKVLVVSKVANFAVDLPDASVAIQVSGTFGSRQEEAQRLGRIMRPKEIPSSFYTIVTRYSPEEEFSANRQKFLAEQGYKYQLEIR
ncbi:MAG: DNA repair helicase XPB [Sphaerochaetaceae bacterium]|jgi:DNA excision repair protein ERCC-3